MPRGCTQVLRDFGVPAEVTIVSAHRTPDRLVSYAKSARGRGLQVIIAGAGGAAHLPGMVAAMTPLPVIGVPVKTSTLSGTLGYSARPQGREHPGLGSSSTPRPGGWHAGNDSLLSIVQMPRGVPVATVAIGNATNAGLLAVRMLGVSQPKLLDAMDSYMAAQEQAVLDKAEVMETGGWDKYEV